MQMSGQQAGPVLNSGTVNRRQNSGRPHQGPRILELELDAVL